MHDQESLKELADELKQGNDQLYELNNAGVNS